MSRTAIASIAAGSAVLLAVIVLRDRSSDAYTLYRSSVMDGAMRIHVATFDATSGEAYNQGNCDLARQLFAAQDGVKVSFWCEKGTYRR